jgi:uncharacterized membrane protein
MSSSPAAPFRAATGLRSLPMTSARRLPVLLLGAAGLVSLGVFIPVTGLRAIVTLVPGLVLPGAALLFGLGALRGRWDPVPTLALCAISSLSFYPLASLLIYVAGLQLSTGTLIAAIDIFVVVMVAIGSWPTLVRASSSEPLITQVPSTPGESLRWGLWLSLVVGAASTVLVLGLVVLPKPAPSSFTQFHLDGSWARVTGTISEAANSRLTIPVTISNASTAATRYLITARLDGKPFASRRRVVVRPSRSWSGSLVGRVSPTGCLQQLVLSLSSVPNGTSITSLDLWIRVRSAECPT